MLGRFSLAAWAPAALGIVCSLSYLLTVVMCSLTSIRTVVMCTLPSIRNARTWVGLSEFRPLLCLCLSFAEV